MKQATIDRIQNAFDVLSIILDRTPSQREVAKAAPASSATISAVWDEISGEVEPRPVYVQVARRCLVCQNTFQSKWVGNRICPKCQGLDAWKDGVKEYSASGDYRF